MTLSEIRNCLCLFSSHYCRTAMPSPCYEPVSDDVTSKIRTNFDGSVRHDIVEPPSEPTSTQACSTRSKNESLLIRQLLSQYNEVIKPMFAARSRLKEVI